MKSKRFFRRLVAFICIITISLSGVAQSPSVMGETGVGETGGQVRCLKPLGIPY